MSGSIGRSVRRWRQRLAPADLVGQGAKGTIRAVLPTHPNGARVADESGSGPERRPGRGRARASDRDGDSAIDPSGGTLFQPRSAVPSRDRSAESDGDWSGHETPTWLPVIDGRSPNAWVCPFLRSVDDDDRVGAPVEAPEPANRCAALREPVPQSLRQQELVCLTSGHVNCPRYLRGAIAVTASPPPTVRLGRAVSPAILGSAVILVLTFSASVAFVVSRGGLDLTPAATPTSSATIAAVVSSLEPSAPPSVMPSVEASIAPPVTPPPTPAPTLAPTEAPSSSPAPTATPAATPQATASPVATSDRFALLAPCPAAPDCWIYRVRGGDNLASIANYFGVSLQSIYDRNPWTRTTSLRAGQELRLPPPTR